MGGGELIEIVSEVGEFVSIDRSRRVVLDDGLQLLSEAFLCLDVALFGFELIDPEKTLASGLRTSIEARPRREKVPSSRSQMRGWRTRK